MSKNLKKKNRFTVEKIFLLALIMLQWLISGCEKVIDVDLNTAQPNVVIEGNLSAKTRVAEINLSGTVSFFGPSATNPISGASIYVETESGSRYLCREVKNGNYKSAVLPLSEGDTYKLTVETQGKLYTATSILNPVVPIDSITYVYMAGFAFIDSGYYVSAYFKDPPLVENYYRLKLYKNGNYDNDNENLIVFDDRLINGKPVALKLHGRTFSEGQKATVELISIDKATYMFYKTFRELLNVNPGSAAPSNPTSNISNHGLGYFSAWSSDQKSVVIEKK